MFDAHICTEVLVGQGSGGPAVDIFSGQPLDAISNQTDKFSRDKKKKNTMDVLELFIQVRRSNSKTALEEFGGG